MCICVFVCRGQPVGGNRERLDAAGSQRSGKSLPSDQQKTLPADGCPGGTQCPGHNIGYSASIEQISFFAILNFPPMKKCQKTNTEK